MSLILIYVKVCRSTTIFCFFYIKLFIFLSLVQCCLSQFSFEAPWNSLDIMLTEVGLSQFHAFLSSTFQIQREAPVVEVWDQIQRELRLNKFGLDHPICLFVAN